MDSGAAGGFGTSGTLIPATQAVRSDKALMAEIRAGLRQLKARKARLYTLEELFR